MPLSSHRFTTTHRYDLVVIHTNEGPEGPTSAEGLAAYIAQPNVTAGYHRTVDENSVQVTCPDNERVNGAGGVNSKAFHICITGYAAQNLDQWNDRSSKLAIVNAAQETRSACQRLGVPMTRTTDPRTGRGICGHVDVSRYFSASEGHTDPGAFFPWDLFLGLVTKSVPAQAKPRAKGKRVNLIQYHGGNAIAVTDGLQKNIFGNPKQMATTQWLMAVQGLNINVSMVDKDYWDSLPTVGK